MESDPLFPHTSGLLVQNQTFFRSSYHSLLDKCNIDQNCLKILYLLDNCQRCGIYARQSPYCSTHKVIQSLAKHCSQVFNSSRSIPYFAILHLLNKFMTPNHVQHEYERNGDQTALKVPKANT